jgi:hypothetical protein
LKPEKRNEANSERRVSELKNSISRKRKTRSVDSLAGFSFPGNFISKVFLHRSFLQILTRRLSAKATRLVRFYPKPRVYFCFTNSGMLLCLYKPAFVGRLDAQAVKTHANNKVIISLIAVSFMNERFVCILKFTRMPHQTQGHARTVIRLHSGMF